MQALRISLRDGERIYADSGKLITKNKNINMTPRIAGGIIKAIERKAVGATGMLTEFKAGGGDGVVSIGGIMPGKIYQITLGEGEQFIAEHYAFIAAEESVNFTMQTLGMGTAFFGGAGFLLQKFTGPGNVFIHVVGDIIEHQVSEDNPLEIDPGHIAGFSPALKYKVTFVDNIRSAMFGGVGLFLAKFEGEGKVVAHSVSRYKLSSEIYLQGLQSNSKK